MAMKQYLVVQDHKSAYPEPIEFEAGVPLTVGRKYEGPEGWDGWFFCETPGQKGGWVPAEIIEFEDGQAAYAREAYSARELNVAKGEILLVSKTLNGWAWCERYDKPETGWVPLASLKEVEQ